MAHLLGGVQTRLDTRCWQHPCQKETTLREVWHGQMIGAVSINRLFAQFLDTVAFERVNTFRKKYTEYGYTLSFEESSRLVLLEKLR